MDQSTAVAALSTAHVLGLLQRTDKEDGESGRRSKSLQNNASGDPSCCPCFAFFSEMLSPRNTPKKPERARARQRLSGCDGSEATLKKMPKAPADLSRCFDSRLAVKKWNPSRWRYVRKLQDAPRNQGAVLCMEDAGETGRSSAPSRHVAVKRMPVDWCQDNHDAFLNAYPDETELPWLDIGTLSWLNAEGFPYACQLLGVYRDAKHYYVVTEVATEGDLLSWCSSPVNFGLVREIIVHRLAVQMFSAVRSLHDSGVVHGDLSLENFLVTQQDGAIGNDKLRLRLIDFGMVRTQRVGSGPSGKMSYRAPESYVDQKYDGFLADAFALGVCLYSLYVKDYPWMSTKAGNCKCFDYVKSSGLRAYVESKKVRGDRGVVADKMSDGLYELIEGLLCLNPQRRLTVGESIFGSRRSVWDTEWLRCGPRDPYLN